MQISSCPDHEEVGCTPNYILEWKDLTYTIKSKNKSQAILKSVSGYAHSGQILAIIGTSGSGKTSLLSILSNRLFTHPDLIVHGDVTLNKIPIKKFHSTHYIKIVLQEDNLFVTQTPREAFTFACRLKVPNLSEVETKERVEQIINDLGLEKVADHIIGSVTERGLSGGEKKRVSIGNELISYPTVLILDEPTSGLDSTTAEHLIEILRKQADIGKTIIFTIHQPSSKIFSLFDRLIVMSEGNFLYQGQAVDSVNYFSTIGYNCPERINPPEYYMRVFYVKDRFNMTSNELDALEKCSNHYKETAEQMIVPDYTGLDDIRKHGRTKNAPMITQLKVLAHRGMQNVKRQKMLSSVKVAQGLLLSILIILIYNRNSNDPTSVQTITGALFFISITFISPCVLGQVITFPVEKPAFLTEYREELYGVLPYYIAKFLCELPFQLIFTVLCSGIIYFAIPLNSYNASKFFIFFGTSIVTQTSGNALGYMIGSIFNSVQLAVFFGPAFLFGLGLFGGFFSNTESLSAAFYWIRYLSPYNYCFRALIINQFTDFELKETNQVNPIDSLNFRGEIWESIGSLLLLTLGMSIIACIGLKISGEYKKTH